MRNSFLILVFGGLVLSGKWVHADVVQLQTLLQRNNCVACHLMDKRKYGPHMREVAAKYAGKAGLVEQMALKIKAGGTGVWGQDVMPPQPQVTDENARLMAQLILSLEAK